MVRLCCILPSKLKDLDKYVGAITKLEEILEEKRATLFTDLSAKKVASAYNSANSKPFQIGLFLAHDVYIDNLPPIEEFKSFVGVLNHKSPNDWVYILTDIRQKVIGSVDSIKWLAYQNPILRAIQGDLETYHYSSAFDQSHDYGVFKEEISNSFNSRLDHNSEVYIDDTTIELVGKPLIDKWAISAEISYKELFHKANINQLKEVDHKFWAQKIVTSLIEKMKNY